MTSASSSLATLSFIRVSEKRKRLARSVRSIRATPPRRLPHGKLKRMPGSSGWARSAKPSWSTSRRPDTRVQPLPAPAARRARCGIRGQVTTDISMQPARRRVARAGWSNPEDAGGWLFQVTKRSCPVTSWGNRRRAEILRARGRRRPSAALPNGEDT